MTIFDKLKIRAAWFRPDESDVQLMGTLDGDSLEVFRNTSFSEHVENFNQQHTVERIPILHGLGEKNATLVDVYQINVRSNMTNLEFVTYRCNDVILDIHYQKTDKIKSLSFSYPFVWGPFHSPKKEDDDFSHYYKIHESVDMDSSVKLMIGQTSGYSSSILEQKTTHSEFFKVESKDGMLLDKLMSYLKPIHYFLRLCIGKTIYPSRMGGSTTSKNSFEYYPYWLLEYHRRNTENVNPKHVAEAIIPYHDLKNNFEAIIQKWFQLWFKTSEIMFDFFNVFDSYISLNTQFTEYTNVLQRFYDSMHPQRAGFREEINWFLDLCPDKVKTDITKDDFVDKIVNTRNYNVHGNDTNLNYVIKDGNELVYLVNDLRSLIEIFLVSQLPIITNKELMQEQIFTENNYSRMHPIV